MKPLMGDRSFATLPPPSGSGPLGLYLHVPFCGTTCDFCAFHQQRPQRGDVERFIEGVVWETGLAPSPRSFDTWFWGGGTPGLLAPKQLASLGESLLRVYGPPRGEWTVEMTPASVTPGRLKVLRDLGVNRLSIGGQSFSDQTLASLGRPHPRKRIFQAFDCARKAGFTNLNIDLIFAIPGQNWAHWESDLKEFLSLGAEHLSTYCLTFEEDTVLWWKLSRGEIKRDEVVEEELYRRTPEFLAEKGYQRYEVSNYGRPGFASQHNLGTWEMGEWIGLGPSAASQQGSWRGANCFDLSEWRDDLRSGRRATAERVSLSPMDLALDALIFGLRMTKGVDLREVSRRFSISFKEDVYRYLNFLIEQKIIHNLGEERLCLTPEGFLVVDRIGSELLEKGLD